MYSSTLAVAFVAVALHDRALMNLKEIVTYYHWNNTHIVYVQPHVIHHRPSTASNVSCNNRVGPPGEIAGWAAAHAVGVRRDINPRVWHRHWYHWQGAARDLDVLIAPHEAHVARQRPLKPFTGTLGFGKELEGDGAATSRGTGVVGEAV